MSSLRFSNCLNLKRPNNTDKETLDEFTWNLFRQWTYEQYFQEAITVAKAFIELGLDRHRTVAILGEDRHKECHNSESNVLLKFLTKKLRILTMG